MSKAVLLLAGVLLFLVAVAQQANTLVNHGNEFYRQGAYDIAAAYYRRAIEKDPDNHVAHYNLANALYRHKKFQGAIDAYKESGKTQGPNLKAASYYNEGVVYSYLKNTEKAVESYKKALRINPDDKEARENLQKALSELKKQQQQKQQNQQQNQSNMSQKEVERRLKMLQEKEKQLQQQLNQKGGGGNQQKDW
jgi:Ca-activated chloride channel homolog